MPTAREPPNLRQTPARHAYQDTVHRILNEDLDGNIRTGRRGRPPGRGCGCVIEPIILEVSDAENEQPITQTGVQGGRGRGRGCGRGHGRGRGRGRSTNMFENLI
ncbi:hypothetical protein M422DRAFT_54899 [Sphaerobolus stellatus SS14]|uniref:Uncharacterized protein n=1 Tax=Sphaerobolus stellatus (strain SS14) TaxID=990650 RepID=A0A0C9UFN9_SPHS4|nr:hypothetical protein M422DRAFT_54899 [Sphaerobolus stellatus SS14]